MSGIRSKYVYFNGQLITEDTFKISIQNRAFKYGDSIFETIRCKGTTPLFFDKHFNRLQHSMQLLHYSTNSFLDYTVLIRNIEHLLNASKFFNGSRLRLTVYRNDGGLYTPDTNDCSYLIEAETLENKNYTLNSTGHFIEVYEDVLKPMNSLSGIKSGNALLYTLAAIYKKQHGFNDCIILNTDKNICEYISSNLFIVKDNHVLTPSLNQGCVNGIMRSAIIEILNYNSISCKDDSVLTIDDILSADELFSTNAISGIQWILGFRKKRFYNKLSHFLITELNQLQ